MTPLAGTADFVLVSDLHVADGDREFPHERLFSRFLDSVQRRSDADGRARRLVLLGDFLDFPRVEAVAPEAVGPVRAAAALDRVVAAHPALFSALRRYLRAGHAIDVVAGNHDADLAHADVQAGLAAAVGGGAGLRFHPWQLYVPGVLYAEHGHQYHDVNAFTTVVEPWAGGRPGHTETTLGAVLDRHAHATGGAAGRHAALVAGLVASGARLADPRRARRRSAYRRDVLPAHAEVAGLPASAALGLDALSAGAVRALPVRSATRAFASVLGRRESPESHYLARAVAGIHAVLAGEGVAVPFYVFGHTHHAGRWRLPAAPEAVCLNTGTWSSRGGRADGRPTYVEITPDGPGGAPAAEVRCLAGDGVLPGVTVVTSVSDDSAFSS